MDHGLGSSEISIWNIPDCLSNLYCLSTHDFKISHFHGLGSGMTGCRSRTWQEPQNWLSQIWNDLQRDIASDFCIGWRTFETVDSVVSPHHSWTPYTFLALWEKNFLKIEELFKNQTKNFDRKNDRKNRSKKIHLKTQKTWFLRFSSFDIFEIWIQDFEILKMSTSSDNRYTKRGGPPAFSRTFHGPLEPTPPAGTSHNFIIHPSSPPRLRPRAPAPCGLWKLAKELTYTFGSSNIKISCISHILIQILNFLIC